MPALLRAAALGAAVIALAAALSLGDPAPEAASANVPCEVATGPVGALTGAVGLGNPAGDACDAVTGPALGAAGKVLDPIKGAIGSVGQGIFEGITQWVADGASWLIGQVVAATDATTSPDLLSQGFLRSYRKMALIAASLAALMLLFAVIDSLGRGDAEGLIGVFLVNVPLAALATSAAYVVVQLLIGATDGFSAAISASTGKDAHDFFKGATEALSVAGAGAGAAAGSGGGPAGAAVGSGAGAVAVPLFVGFIGAVVAAFAALAVWIELLMRSAAIYAVALFMPLSIAAAIWPRWSSALRRTAELLIAVIGSKFVIVSVVALATSLLANAGGRVEHVLSAAALLLLACFAPFVLYRLVPFGEGAISNLYNRQSAASAGVRSVEFASSVALLRRSALTNWGQGGGDGGGAEGGSQGGGSSPAGGGRASGGRQDGGGSGGVGAGAAGGEGAGAAGAAGAAGMAAAGASKGAAAKLAGTGVAQGVGSEQTASSGSGSGAGAQSGAGRQAPPRPQSSERSSESAPAPAGGEGEAGGGEGAPAPAAQSKPPRPAGALGTAGGAGKPAGRGGGAAAGAA